MLTFYFVFWFFCGPSELPAVPGDLQVLSMVDGNVTLSWQPGFDGHSALLHCILQVGATRTHTRIPAYAHPIFVVLKNNQFVHHHPLPTSLIPPVPVSPTLTPQLSRQAARRWELPQQEVPVPPHLQVVSGLRSYCNYSARVSCVNEVGASPFSPWLHFRTPESGDSAAGRLVGSAHIHINKKQTKTVAKNKKNAAGLR